MKASEIDDFIRKGKCTLSPVGHYFSTNIHEAIKASHGKYYIFKKVCVESKNYKAIKAAYKKYSRSVRMLERLYEMF